jgi:hypothetical protein
LGTNKILIENISRTYCEHIKNLLGIKNLLWRYVVIVMSLWFFLCSIDNIHMFYFSK